MINIYPAQRGSEKKMAINTINNNIYQKSNDNLDLTNDHKQTGNWEDNSQQKVTAGHKKEKEKPSWNGTIKALSADIVWPSTLTTV